MHFITLSLLVVTVIAIIGLKSVLSIQCYECEYPNDKTCLDPFTTTKLSTLTNYQVCSKAKAHLNGQDILGRAGVPDELIDRVCIGGRNSCKEGHQGSQNGIVCCCTTDRCNSGNIQGGSLHLLALVAGISAILRLMF